MLIPANDLNIEKKKFTWGIKQYSESGFRLQLDFENPKYISFGGTDTIKMTLFNTNEFLAPKNQTLASIPDGYTIVVKLPPQGSGLMSSRALLSTK